MTDRAAVLNKPRLGILLLIGFCAFAPASDALVKLLGDTVPLVQVLIARFALLLFLLRPKLWVQRRLIWLRRDMLGWIILRSLLHLIAIACFFVSLRFLPLADALAIAYVMPFIVLGVGAVQGEKVTAVRLMLCFIGFIGTLMVIEPSFATVGWPAFLPVAVAILFTSFMFITRRISSTIETVDLQAMHGVITLAILLPLATLGTTLDIFPLRVISISPWQLLMLLGVGGLGIIAHLMMNYALRFASPPAIAPVQYLEISFGAFYGWFLFGDWPSTMAMVGILVTILAGLALFATAPKEA